MKTPSEDLFDLISSLTKQEKNYFIRHVKSNREENRNYLKLFYAIDKQGVYDEKSLKESLKKEKFIKHLWATKKYLYNLILRSLNEINEAKDAQYKINNAYNSALSLADKKLWDQSLRIILEAKKLCVEEELFSFLAKFIILERKILNITLYTRKTEKDISTLYRDISKLLILLKNYNVYQYYSAKFFLQIRYVGSVKTKETLLGLDKILKKSIYKSEKKALTLETKLIYNTVYFFYNNLKGNHEQCYFYSKRSLELFESSNSKMKRIYTYLQYLDNHLTSCVRTGRFIEFNVYLEIYQKALNKIDDIGNIFSIMLHSHKMDYYKLSGQYEKADNLLKETEYTIVNSLGKKRDLIICQIFLNGAYMNFLLGRYERCIYNLEFVLQSKELGNENEILISANILNLLLHFELGNHELLESKLRSFFRNLSKKDSTLKLERIIYSFIKKSLNIKNENELKMVFINFHFRLKKIENNLFENAVFDYIDLISWLESKMTGKKFAEVVKAKLKA